MSDDKSQAGRRDRERISFSEDCEMHDWAKRFGVTPEQLQAAVRAVGNKAATVEAHLKGSR